VCGQKARFPNGIRPVLNLTQGGVHVREKKGVMPQRKSAIARISFLKEGKESVK